MDESRRQVGQERFLHASVELKNGCRLANCRIHDLAREGRGSCLQPCRHPDFERRVRALPADRARDCLRRKLRHGANRTIHVVGQRWLSRPL